MCGAGDGQGRLPGYRELGHAHIGKVVPEHANMSDKLCVRMCYVDSAIIVDLIGEN